jgi:hypothetical protein
MQQSMHLITRGTGMSTEFIQMGGIVGCDGRKRAQGANEASFVLCVRATDAKN